MGDGPQSCGWPEGDVYSLEVPRLGGITLQAKETVRKLLDQLPDDCSLDDVQYHLYVLQSIERGRADVEAGRTLSHDDATRELRKKWLESAAG